MTEHPQASDGTSSTGTPARSVRETERAEHPEASPTPGEILYDDGGMPDAYLVEGTLAALMESLDDADLQTMRFRIIPEWYRVRWTTPKELADEEWLYQQFGDHETNGIDTTLLYERLADETPDAHLYVRIETASDSQPADDADAELQHIKRLLRPLLPHESIWQGVDRLREERAAWEQTATVAQGENDLYRAALERISLREAPSDREAAEMHEIARNALQQARAVRQADPTDPERNELAAKGTAR